ncbi:MAG TPA: beta-ribofuranosylaminobenzene 5'-phosphate synthase family protein [Candidatus Polarisedimenticolia bacterium]|nr:beta-ribofuranosylaminobenzene 5'-phosphate synthase family protein [Candidatus Polarisedimenticolia bacterium]
MHVDVRAHARLHFGFLDPSRQEERRFGGMGLSISRPRCVLRLDKAATLRVEGEQADRVEILAERFFDALELKGGAHIRVLEAIPGHVGLGSGTQLALALAAGLSRLRGVDLSPARLCALMGRARRSGVGFHAFQRGGFVVEGGHPTGPRHPAAETPPLLLRQEFPEGWRIVLALPTSSHTVSGEAEEKAFERLGPAPGEAVDRIARIVLMRLLPALVERDLAPFGAALAEVQELVGSCFAAVQDGLFHPAGAALVRRLKEAGACGVGQSSWGPAVYALAGDEAEEERLVGILRRDDPGLPVISARGWNRGAAIESRST